MEPKERYYSFAHYQPDRSEICSTQDTLFLDVERNKPEKEVPHLDVPEALRSSLRRSGKFSGVITPCRSEDSADTSPEPEWFDNFLGNKPRFHTITLYETKSRFYLVASLKENSSYKIMKIDRDAPTDVLSVDMDPSDYTATQLHQLLHMINEGNKANNGLRKVTSGDGLLGFIRFTQGYYLVMITEKEKCGAIGPHQIYSVIKTGYVYIPNESKVNSAEKRYKNLFFSMDFTDFYFSYTYDLTHTLQHNLTYTGSPFYNKSFAWNHYLMKPLLARGEEAGLWMHPLIHGYFAQNTLAHHGRQFRMSIIARRSRYFAGTRYLKRGVNNQGQVANDVETEQIAEDCNGGVLQATGSFAAHVQIRGSIPLFWGQESRPLTPKPPIFLQQCDPLYAATKLHFRDLFRRFGYPIIVLNLVKKKEKKPRESILRSEFNAAIQEINEPLPEHYKLRYISWDFSRAAKSESENVIVQMSTIAEESLMATNFFHSGKHVNANKTIRDKLFAPIVGEGYNERDLGRIQRGVLRSNCIDSLDRTNAAQFVVGKVVMGYQLYVLGIINSPEIDFDGKIAEVLMYLYQNMGNNLAMQYGGSELAHTMQAYKNKETRGLRNRPRDLLTSVHRYYSNSMLDQEKQYRINLFLGNYKPWQETIDLWDLETDYYLHMKDPSYSEKMMLFEQWWENSVTLHNNQKENNPLSERFYLRHPSTDSSLAEIKRTLFYETYDVSRYTYFSKKLKIPDDSVLQERDDPVVNLENFDDNPSSHKEQNFYYGRRKKWLTIAPTDNNAKSTPRRIEVDWDPNREAHPDFEIAQEQLRVQQYVWGPEQNLLKKYNIRLKVTTRNRKLYQTFVRMRVPTMPSAQQVAPVRPPPAPTREYQYTQFGSTSPPTARRMLSFGGRRAKRSTVQTTNLELDLARPNLGAIGTVQSMVDIPAEKRRASSVQTTNLFSSQDKIQQPRGRTRPRGDSQMRRGGSFVNNQQTSSNSRVQAPPSIYSDSDEALRQKYQKLFDYQTSRETKSSDLYRYQVKQFNGRSVITTTQMSITDISNRSFLCYTKACAQQC